MSKLDELTKIVADAFKCAETKESIEKLATINNAIKEAKAEEDALTAKNAELIKSYKDLIQHTSFKDEAKPTDPVAPTVPSFEDALQAFMDKQGSK